ncbi:MAG: sialidase family protein [Actinomycetota bacterium]
MLLPPAPARADTPVPGPNVRANQDSGTAPQNEVHIAVNPADAQNVVAGANDYRTGGGTGVYTTTDGGVSWIDGILPTPPGVDSGGDPVVRFNRDGSKVFFTHLGFESIGTLKGCDPSSGVYVATSTDQGNNWTTGSVPVGANSALVFNDKPWITSDRTTGPNGGNVYLTYTKFTYTDTLACQNGAATPLSPIKLRRSTDGGATWSGSEADVSGTYLASQGSASAVAGDGTLYVAFETFTGCADCLVVARSTDGGQNFTQAKVVDITGVETLPAGAGTFRADSFPSIAVASDGTLIMVWNEKRGGSTTTDVWFSTSANGSTWSAPARVNVGTSGDQFFPAVTVEASGVVWVSYSDRRDDPSNILYRQYVSHSHDGGATWSDTQVADASSDPRTVLFDGELFIGDYNGIDAAPGGGVWMGWCDTRRSDGGIGHQDAFAARVDLGGAPSSLTASVSPVIAVWGTTFTVSGALTGAAGLSGRQITVQKRPVGTAAWANVTTVGTDAGGGYSAVVGKPDRYTDYRAVFGGGGGLLGSVSGATRAQVRVGVILNVADSTLSRGQTAVLSGQALPGHPGKKVFLHQLTNSGWVVVQTITLDSASRYRATARLTTSGFRLYRIAYPTQDSEHAWNISRNVGVRWS